MFRLPSAATNKHTATLWIRGSSVGPVTYYDCQARNLYSQLQDGIRLFDIDISMKDYGIGGDSVWFVHGDMGYHPSVRQGLDTIGEWLDNNPTDVVLIGMSNIEKGESPSLSHVVPTCCRGACTMDVAGRPACSCMGHCINAEWQKCHRALQTSIACPLPSGVTGAKSQFLDFLSLSKLARHAYTGDRLTGSEPVSRFINIGQRAIFVFYDAWGEFDSYKFGVDKVLQPHGRSRM